MMDDKKEELKKSINAMWKKVFERLKKDFDKKANLDGSNATGTWDIDISGKATSATYATTSTNAGTATYAATATKAGTATYATNSGTSSYTKSAPTYKGATTAASGTGGFVPAATTATKDNFLRGDGTWAVPSKATSATSATYAATATKAGTATYATNSGTSSYGTKAGTATYATSAGTADKLKNARTIRTNLASTATASFNGSGNVTPGVTGTLPVANGGTGKTTLEDSANALINGLGLGDSTPEDSDYYVAQYAGGGTTNTTFYRRPVSALWEYMKGKISSVLGLTASSYSGNAKTATSATSATYATTATKAGTANTLSYSVNPIDSTAKDTGTNWKSKGNSIHWFDKTGYLNGQPSQYGFLLNLIYSSDVKQLWFTANTGNLCHRGGNNGNIASTWRTLLDSSNYSGYAIPLSGTSALAGNIIPKTDVAYSLGSSSKKFTNAFVNYLYLYNGLTLNAHSSINCGSYNGTLGYYGSTNSSYWAGVYTKGIYLNGTKSSPVLYYDSTNTTTMYKSGSTTKTETMGVVLASPRNMYLNAGYIYLNGAYVSASNFSYSDPTVKTFTEDIKTDEEKLSMLFDYIGICSYTFRTEDTNAVKFGVNAEELENLCLELGIDIDKYSFLDISYNYMLPASNSEDCKFYTKFRYVSYNDLFVLAMRELQKLKKRFDTIDARLSALENK